MANKPGPAFTLEEWKDRFRNLDDLSQFGPYEEMFRQDCMEQRWKVSDWSAVTAVAREVLKSLQDKNEAGRKS